MLFFVFEFSAFSLNYCSSFASQSGNLSAIVLELKTIISQLPQLTLKCKFKCYLNPWIAHWALALVKGKGNHTRQRKNLLTSVGIEPTTHNIHMYPYFLFAAIHHLKSSPTFSVRPCSSVGRVTVDLFRRSWLRGTTFISQLPWKLA